MGNTRLDQRRAPIFTALQQFRNMRVVPFDVPGHKRGRGNPELVELLGEKCVGLDVNNVDFRNNRILIRRKGGYEDVVYFGDEVEAALKDYLDERLHIIPESGHENALFLSLQNKRLSVRSVEMLVKKYAYAAFGEMLSTVIDSTKPNP